MEDFKYQEATIVDMERIWDKNIKANPKWIAWRNEAIENYKDGTTCKTFVILNDNDPIGEVTMIFSPKHKEIGSRIDLADGVDVANINALRVDKSYRNQGHSTKLMRAMEQHAVSAGYKRLTIGVEPKDARNIAIYLHWGYTNFVRYDIEEGGELVLYYSKTL